MCLKVCQGTPSQRLRIQSKGPAAPRRFKLCKACATPPRCWPKKTGHTGLKTAETCHSDVTKMWEIDGNSGNMILKHGRNLDDPIGEWLETFRTFLESTDVCYRLDPLQSSCMGQKGSCKPYSDFRNNHIISLPRVLKMQGAKIDQKLYRSVGFILPNNITNNI